MSYDIILSYYEYHGDVACL